MNIILFDTPEQRRNLLPLTYTRPIGEFRCGVYKLSEKWSKRGQNISFLTEKYLSEKFNPNYTEDNLYINGSTLYSTGLWNEIQNLEFESLIKCDNKIIALRTSKNLSYNFDSSNFNSRSVNTKSIENIWDIFKYNGQEIKNDFSWITANNKSEQLNDKFTAAYNEENIFIEKGAKIKAAVLNAENGPIYIGKNAEIQEGVLIAGPFALCESSVVNMGAKMRGDNTIGPHSKVGGEIGNSVIFGYSNKGHDGYMGNSVIGEWCNLGADTNTSNLKNNYANVKLWNYEKKGFKDTEEQFCGLIMGDHSKCGINTMFNTGTVVGVSANIFGSGFPRNFIPSFSWGGASGFTTFQTRKAYEVADKVMQRRKKEFNETEQSILNTVFDLSSEYRVWENK